METMQLVAESREASTKGAAREVRRNGRIPAVLYGEGEPKAISVDAKDWGLRFGHVSGNTILTMKLGKDEHRVLVKDTQDNILTDSVMHIDFYAIHAGQKLHTTVPVHLEGNPPGVKEGGILEHIIESLDIVCLPKDMPSQFSLDISGLQLGDSLHISDLTVPEGVEVRADAKDTMVVVSHPKGNETAAESDEAGEDE